VSIQINLHKTHRRYTNGHEAVYVEGNNVKECLNDLIAQYPPLRKEIFDKKGQLNPLMEIYLNGESAYPNELVREVNNGDKIHLVYMLAGG
jgi:molybdopterin converting factor small subunit